MAAFLGLMLLTFQFAFAQNLEVSGKVTDVNGTPLANVSVTERGAKSGTTTDANGNFKLSVKRNATLDLTSVGFQTKTVSAGTGSFLTISLSY